jgi:hypothetical protein
VPRPVFEFCIFRAVDAALQRTDGPELLGGIVPTVWNGAVFAPDAMAPVITCFDIGDGDRLVRGAELSFAGVGMTRLESWHVFVSSDTQGYVFDPAGLRLIERDPSQMQLTGVTIPLAMRNARAGCRTWCSSTPASCRRTAPCSFRSAGKIRTATPCMPPACWR